MPTSAARPAWPAVQLIERLTGTGYMFEGSGSRVQQGVVHVFCLQAATHKLCRAHLGDGAQLGRQAPALAAAQPAALALHLLACRAGHMHQVLACAHLRLSAHLTESRQASASQQASRPDIQTREKAFGVGHMPLCAI